MRSLRGIKNLSCIIEDKLSFWIYLLVIIGFLIRFCRVRVGRSVKCSIKTYLGWNLQDARCIFYDWHMGQRCGMTGFNAYSIHCLHVVVLIILVLYRTRLYSGPSNLTQKSCYATAHIRWNSEFRSLTLFYHNKSQS